MTKNTDERREIGENRTSRWLIAAAIGILITGAGTGVIALNSSSSSSAQPSAISASEDPMSDVLVGTNESVVLLNNNASKKIDYVSINSPNRTLWTLPIDGNERTLSFPMTSSRNHWCSDAGGTFGYSDPPIYEDEGGVGVSSNITPLKQGQYSVNAVVSQNDGTDATVQTITFNVSYSGDVPDSAGTDHRTTFCDPNGGVSLDGDP